MIIPGFRNPKWCKDGSSIDCEINHPKYGWVPFTCIQDDDGTEFDAAVLYQLLLEASPALYEEITPSDEQLAYFARSQRDSLLAESDWTQLPDVPQAVKDAWASYRQALRDLPQQAGFPSNIQWPVKP